MELDAPVRLRPMEKKRHADVRDVTGDKDEHERLPPRRSPTPEIWHRVVLPSWCRPAPSPEAPTKRPGTDHAAGQMSPQCTHPVPRLPTELPCRQQDLAPNHLPAWRQRPRPSAAHHRPTEYTVPREPESGDIANGFPHGSLKTSTSLWLA